MGLENLTKESIESIEIDATPKKSKYLIKINEIPIFLTNKSFIYFTLLANARGKNEGWIHKQDIELGDNQPRYLYRMKEEISKIIGKDWKVIENDKNGYYRLDINPNIISFNIPMLKKHYHYNIKNIQANQKIQD